MGQKEVAHAARRRAIVAKVGAVAAVSAVAVPFTANPASAAKSQCTGDSLCQWEDGGFNSAFRSWGSSSADVDYRDNNYFNNGGGLNDSISSIWNNSGRWVKMYRDLNGAGDTICLAPGMAVSDLHNQKIDPGDIIPPIDTWGNRMSGHRTYASQPAGCDVTINDDNHLGCSM